VGLYNSAFYSAEAGCPPKSDAASVVGRNKSDGKEVKIGLY
jgi:hypothetical protein